MKVIQKLHQMNLTDMLKDISEAIEENRYTIPQCLCSIIWDKVLKLPHDKFLICYEVCDLEFIEDEDCHCIECHQKCLEALMEKDI